jgi:hypothetical protein
MVRGRQRPSSRTCPHRKPRAHLHAPNDCRNSVTNTAKTPRALIAEGNRAWTGPGSLIPIGIFRPPPQAPGPSEPHRHLPASTTAPGSPSLTGIFRPPPRLPGPPAPPAPSGLHHGPRDPQLHCIFRPPPRAPGPAASSASSGLHHGPRVPQPHRHLPASTTPPGSLSLIGIFRPPPRPPGPLASPKLLDK